MTSPMISIRELRKVYGDPSRGGTVAVDDVTLDIHPGEVFALLGPNGAGKTTIVEILEGYRDRTSGAVTVLGEDPGTPSRTWRQRVGIVLQASSGLDELTVAEIIRHFAHFYPRPRDADELITAVGLEDKRNTRARHLSGGQRRRLDVALGMVGNPDLLFLDEPTTGFDPEARRDFWALISALAHQGTTIVLTTHYLDEAEHLADRVAVITAGRIVALDAPARLGGRDRDRAVVTWTENGTTQRVESAEPTAVVAALAARNHGEIPDLTIGRPTLEDVYLRLIRADATRNSGITVGETTGEETMSR